MKRVAIIGAGPAGLCAARHFARDPGSLFSAKVFERSETIGGLWAYDKRTEFEFLENLENVKRRSTMYRNLRTNLPKQIMAFPDFPCPNDFPTFLSHTNVHEYLKIYAEKHDLMKCTELQTEVVHVDPVGSEGAKPGFVQWEVTTRKTESGQESKDLFDAVLICNGHFTEPKMPAISNASLFRGHMLHSSTYKTPEPFKGLSVVVLGAGASGRDIAVDLSPWARDVTLSHKRVPLPTQLPDQVSEKPPIQDISRSGQVIFSDGTSQSADAIIFSTGYHYSLPFLSKNCRTEISDATITPLFKHLFHILFPSLGFIGLGREICPFALFHYQVQCFKAVLSGQTKLPPIEDMFITTYKEIREREKLVGRYDQYHNFGPRQWSYYDNLADLAKIPRLPGYIQKLYDHVLHQRNHDLLNYRKQNFRLVNHNEFTQL